MDVLCIVGPTAVGKTKMSIELAKQLNGEITSDDYVDAFDLSLEDLGSQGHNKMQNDFYSVNMMGKDNH